MELVMQVLHALYDAMQQLFFFKTNSRLIFKVLYEAICNCNPILAVCWLLVSLFLHAMLFSFDIGD